MILVTSAAYITPGLASEFGKLPPSMLPVQNKRLYEHQVALMPKEEILILSLPRTYILPDYDKRRLSSLGIRVIHVPDELTLGQSIIYVLNVVGRYNESLSILHGDTLFGSLTPQKDFCAVAKAEIAYDWAKVDNTTEEVFSGFFSFSDQSLLIQKITECGYNFIEGISEYNKEKPLILGELPEWMDFGLINSYYRSISKMTTQRVFNSMKATGYSIIKSSRDKQKMIAESNWFQSLPVNMRHYAPTVWNCGEDEDCGFYEIEYYYLPSLANLWVFGKNKAYVWEEIINACVKYLNDEYLEKPLNIYEVAHCNNDYYGVKTLQRLQEYSEQSGMSLDKEWCINGVMVPSLREIVESTDAMIAKNDIRFATMMHGDPCFSNILYDFRSKSIKVIDPRGRDNNGNLSIYGDFRYDVSKLAHSIIGMYDFIIGGMFDFQENGTYNVRLKFEENEELYCLQEYFRSQIFGGYTYKELNILPILIHLFLSMLPLHSDNQLRQKALLANALRLYVELNKTNI